MKNLFSAIIILLSTLFLACNSGNTPANDPQNILVVSENADSLTLEAAETLQSWWLRISGKLLPVVNTPETGKTALFLGKPFATEALNDSLALLSDDGFIIAPLQNGVFLGGKYSLGDIYSATTFLEQHLGCMLLVPGAYYAPKQDQITVPDIMYKAHNPDFDFRRTRFPGQHDREYRNWYKLEQLDDWGVLTPDILEYYSIF